MTGPDAGASEVRVRRGRMFAASSALVVTMTAVLGGIGVLPTDATPAAEATGGQATLSSLTIPDANRSSNPATPLRRSDAALSQDEVELPTDTGRGKRIVFDISAQRVWLVDPHDAVRSTYLVSGSVTDNLAPGTYAVYSRSRHAVGVDDSGTMEFFVRFTHGDHAAIGFHSIPTKDGHLLQTAAMLGTPRSHGCIRQKRPDAQRLWAFAPIGTKVVVTA